MSPYVSVSLCFRSGKFAVAKVYCVFVVVVIVLEVFLAFLYSSDSPILFLLCARNIHGCSSPSDSY